MANPVDITVQGMALNDLGFVANNTISGLGLITFGFLWPCQDIWSPADPSIATTWISCLPAVDTIETCTD